MQIAHIQLIVIKLKNNVVCIKIELLPLPLQNQKSCT